MSNLFGWTDTLATLHDPGGKIKVRLREGIAGTAEFSDCMHYRFKLSRRWEDGPAMLIVMMNPSIADATNVDDLTVDKCGKIARHLGMGALWVGNTCAWRTTDKMRLLQVADPVGPRNIPAVLEMARAAALVVVAHGQLPGGLQVHADAMCTALRADGHRLHVLGLSKDGIPMHPLARGKSYIPVTTTPVLWPA